MTAANGAGRPQSGRRGRKRANGEGTIYQRKDGRWEGAAFVLTTAGTHRRARVYALTRDDARKKLTKLIQQSDQGIPVASSTWTVAEYLNYWLSTIVLNERRPKTYQGYEGVVRLHLIPGIGKKRLAKLTGQDVRIFLTCIRQECQCCKHGWDSQRDKPRCCALGQCCDSRLSVRMVQFIHAVLRNALESAVREEIIPRNVAKLVQVSAPRYKVNRGLTVQQAKATMAAAAGHRLLALYVLALYLGLRRRGAARAPLAGCRLGRSQAGGRPHPPAGRRRPAPGPAEDRGLRADGAASPGVRGSTAGSPATAGDRTSGGMAGLGGSRVRLPISPRYSDGAG